MRYEAAPAGQLALFEAPVVLPQKGVPGGLMYREDFLSVEEERALLEIFAGLPFKHAEHQGYQAFRRIVGYGWDSHPELPGFITPLRDRAAEWIGVAADTLDTALISEYTPGAAIGWHRDKPTIGHVVGVSLGAPCRFCLRRKRGEGWDRFAVPAAARSAYCMRGESRRDWQHGIPPVSALRYSITFRDF